MSSVKMKNSFKKCGIHPYDYDAPDYFKIAQEADRTLFEVRKQDVLVERGTQRMLNVATQTMSTQSSENNFNLRENSVLVALGAQRQIISKGCDDSVLVSYRFEALLFSKREKWIEFVFKAELNSTISPMFQMKIKKESRGEDVNLNWEVDPSSYSIQPHDNLTIESDQEDEIGLGADELLQPSTKMEVDVLREDHVDEIVYMELLDPLGLPELDVDVERLGPSLLDDSANRGKTRLDPPSNLVLKDDLIVKEEWDDEKYSYQTMSIESDIERVLIHIEKDIEVKGESNHLNRVESPPINRKPNPKRLPVPAFKFAEEKKEQMETISRSTTKRSEFQCLINGVSPSCKRIRLNPEPFVNVNVESVNNINSDHKLKPLKCRSCNYVCSENETLSKHILSVHKNKNQHRPKCPICDLSFDIIETLAIHITTVHKKFMPFKCTICDGDFGRKSSLTQHILSVHKKLKRYKCNKCNYSSYKRSAISYHIDTVHKKLKQFKCTICDGEFTQKSSLNLHILKVHKKLKRFKCDQCNYASYLRSQLSYHIKYVHEKIKPFKCTICDGDFTHKSSLNLHILKEHKKTHEEIKPFKCLKCNSSFSQKGNLKMHMKSVHDKIKPFKCLECNYSCSLKCNLKNHMKSVHEKLKPFKCLECNFSCSLKFNLKSHMKVVHEKIKPFKCLECNYSCSLKRNLESHMMSVHEKLKSFKCLECNFSCSLKFNLKSHIKVVHEKIKPFKCLECNYSSSKKGNLESHMKVVHGKTKPLKCL